MTIRITQIVPEIVYQEGSSALTDPPPAVVQDVGGLCCEFRGPLKVGDSAAIITIESGGPDPITGIKIYAELGDCGDGNGGWSDTYSDSYSDPTDGGNYPGATITDTMYTITDMPANSTLIIDAAEQTVRFIDSSSGESLSTLDLLEWAGVFEWITTARYGCQLVCFDISEATYNSDTSVNVVSVGREL